jgi:hypothetical protein
VSSPIRLRAAPTQAVEILATGPGLESLMPALLTAESMQQAGLPPDLEGLLSLSSEGVAALPAPDVVQLFALAVNEGFFGSTGHAPAAAHCTTHFEAASATRVWILRVTDTPPRSFRVLLALLDGLEAHGLAVRTSDGVPGDQFDVEHSGWPAAPDACAYPLALEDLDVLEEAGTMHVRFEAQRPLTTEETADVERCFEIWTALLLSGGYVDRPLAGAPPIDLMPGGWENDRTWAQDFEVFRCAPESVYPVLHFTSRLARRIPVRRLQIESDPANLESRVTE